MPERVLIEELHLQFHITTTLSQSQERAVLRTVRSARFPRRLLRAAQGVKRAYRSLRAIRMTLSR